MHLEVFSQIETLARFDKCYETTIWDYDPRFTVDYLPQTKRGIDNAPFFIYDVNYTDDENKWRKFTGLLDTISRQKVRQHAMKTNKETGENMLI